MKSFSYSFGGMRMPFRFKVPDGLGESLSGDNASDALSDSDSIQQSECLRQSECCMQPVAVSKTRYRSGNRQTAENSTCDRLHPSSRCWRKRLLDVLGAVVGLLMTVFVAIPIAIAIRLDSSGPILFSQMRCGLNGETFRLWKFRTMVENAEGMKASIENEVSGCFFKNESDPRITRVGRFLRKTSLDELPQFWNVLLGDMSLVGTRPPTIEEVSQYQPHHFVRLLVKPGITGEWQVNGRSSVRDFEDVVELDMSYQQRWSILYDVVLLLKTVWVVFLRKGAF
ncbi:MAG: sugar transferase [Cyanobacteria bacterium P01_E01_bin.34]